MILRRPATKPPRSVPAVNADAAMNELLMHVFHLETLERKYEGRFAFTVATLRLR